MKGGKRKCNRNGRFEGKRVKTAAGTKLAGKGTSLGYAETQNTDVGIKRSENDRFREKLPPFALTRNFRIPNFACIDDYHGTFLTLLLLNIV